MLYCPISFTKLDTFTAETDPLRCTDKVIFSITWFHRLRTWINCTFSFHLICFQQWYQRFNYPFVFQRLHSLLVTAVHVVNWGSNGARVVELLETGKIRSRGGTDRVTRSLLSAVGDRSCGRQNDCENILPLIPWRWLLREWNFKHLKQF